MGESSGDSALTDLDKKIIRQIEYYFGDINLPRDRFLQEKIKEDDGWVTLEVMLNFNRLRSISDSQEAIAASMKKSTSGLVEVSEDSTKIRRSPSKPLPDNTKERKDDLTARTYYVKPFPADITLDTLTEFFEKFGKIESILMRRYGKPEREFKGSVFVVFANKEEGDKFLALEKVEYESTELIKKTKNGYFLDKAEEEKKRKSEKNQEKEAAEKEGEKKFEDQITKGSILFIKGLKEETTREDIKAYFGDYGTVAWVEFNKGDDKALLRIPEGQAEEIMKKSMEANDGKIIINTAELEARVLDGEEELDYWKKMYRDLAERKKHQSNKRKGKGGHFNKKFQGKRKSAGGGGDRAPKAAKTE